MINRQNNFILFGILFLCFFFCNVSLSQKKISPLEKKSKPIQSQENWDKKIEVQDTLLKSTFINDSIRSLGKMTLKLHLRNGRASYYADKFTGRRAANGSRFSNNEYTCAHRKFPFGTRLKVTSEKTKKSTIVVVTDRGPFVRGRDIDLSKRSFIDIAGGTGSGVISVTIEIVQK